jgi:UDP-N-acetylmuramyl pentapeptide synthase
MLPDVVNWVKGGDVILVKSSHGTELARVAGHLAKNM